MVVKEIFHLQVICLDAFAARNAQIPFLRKGPKLARVQVSEVLCGKYRLRREFLIPLTIPKSVQATLMIEAAAQVEA